VRIPVPSKARDKSNSKEHSKALEVILAATSCDNREPAVRP
jgi:hypothetical protein